MKLMWISGRTYASAREGVWTSSEADIVIELVLALVLLTEVMVYDEGASKKLAR